MKGRAAVAILMLVAVTAAGCSGADKPADGGAAEVPAEGQGNACDTPAAERGGIACDPFSDVAVFPGDYDTTGLRSRTLETGPFKTMEPEVEHLTSLQDGIAIEVGLVRPDTGDVRVPVIALGSPYLPVLTQDNFGVNPAAAWLLENYVSHGYAVALIVVRGTGGSGGCFDSMGPLEQADLDQAVTWLGEQPWSDGNVGMVGTSYEGAPPWEVAATGNPHLKTIVPIEGITSHYELAYPNGTAWNGMSVWSGIYTYGAPAIVDGANGLAARSGSACPDLLLSTAAGIEGTLRGDEDLIEYFRLRNTRPAVEANYRGSVFVVHGLSDPRVLASQVYPWIDRLEANGTVVKHLLGQWDHGDPDKRGYFDEDPRVDRHDWAETLLHWFDYWLKGDLSVDLGARVQVQDEDYAWRIEEDWPPADAVPEQFFLAPGDSLADEPADATARILLAPNPVAIDHTARSDGYLSGGPARIPERPYSPVPCPLCPEFATDPLDAELRFAGLPRVHLTVTPQGPGGQLAGHLYIEAADSTRMLVGEGAINLRFAGGGMEPHDVIPGQPLVAMMQLQALDVVAPAGSRLVLVVSEGTYTEHLVPMQPYPMELHVGADESVMTLDVFDGSTRTFFEMPWDA